MRIRSRVLALAAGAAFAVAGPAGAYHPGATCSVSSGTPLLGSPQTGVLSRAGEIDAYKVALPAGEHHLFVVAAGGDADLTVCKVGDVFEACKSENVFPLPEACVANGLGGNPGVGKPLAGPGTFRIMLKHCFGFDPEAGGCDYGQGAVPEDTMPATPIAYVISVR